MKDIELIEVITCDNCRLKSLCKNMEHRNSALNDLKASVDALSKMVPEWGFVQSSSRFVRCEDFVNANRCRDCIHCKESEGTSGTRRRYHQCVYSRYGHISGSGGACDRFVKSEVRG